MNKLENQESKSMEGAVTPPPFNTRVQNERNERNVQGEQDGNPSENTSTVNEQIAALGLDETDAVRLATLTQGMAAEALTEDLLTTLARGITHDNDVQNADAAGYLRGRNEKIEAVLHPEPQGNDEGQTTPVFPRYQRRSIWD